MGLFAYFIANNALNQRGKTILKNAVLQATKLVEEKHRQVVEGVESEADAQEMVKVLLSGPLNEDGTRQLNHQIDIGDSGYFIIYDSRGYEIMHPTLEGQNVWDVTDMSDQQHKLVQNQIQTAMDGGGFITYSWQFPNSDRIGRKISYGQYYEPWDWIILATAYEVDFNQEAETVLYMILAMMVLLIVLVSVILGIFIKTMTKPITKISEGMMEIAKGNYKTIDVPQTTRETRLLNVGYNHMVKKLKQAKNDIEKKNRDLEYLAFHDELTHLLNFHGLKEYVNKQLSKGSREGYLVQVDIAGLKLINSTLGYEQGNQLLVLVGQFFVDKDQAHYVVARTGSNEFTVWVVDYKMDYVMNRISEFRKDLKYFLVKKGYNHTVELHVSMAVYDESVLDFDKLYEHLTMAMKHAKDRGDYALTLYSPEIETDIKNEMLMSKYLHNGIESGEIIAYYQEKVDLTNQVVVGLEALARWISPDIGFVSPGVFIPAIERLNLMEEFSRYMMDYVLKDYEKLVRKYHEGITVSINISPTFFMNPQFCDALKDCITKHQVPPEAIIIEITEDIFISDYELIKEVIDKTHQLGVRISIDDFGTGYSSLNYLTNMDFDEMKIDRSFIDKILTEDKVFQMFKILCEIAETYDYEIIAEGVETEEQLELIKTTSLRIIQGYLFSKPEPL
jgi:diguanylate cyclase (GGDEF)-like protein